MNSEGTFHVEVETCAVDGLHVAGEDVEVDADALSVWEGHRAGGFSMGGGASRGGEKGEVVALLGQVDELGKNLDG